MSERWTTLLKGIERRLEHARLALGPEPFDWEGLAGRLRRCRRPQALRDWAGALPEALQSAPLGEYVRAAVAREGKPIRVTLPDARQRHTPSADLVDLGVTELAGSCRDAAFEYGQEALLAWETWAPHLDDGLFELAYSGPFDPCRPDATVIARIDARLAAAQGEVLGLQYYTPQAFRIPSAVLRQRWAQLLAGHANDWLLLPIEPPVAAWALCYFHHEELQFGRLKGAWQHPPPTLSPAR